MVQHPRWSGRAISDIRAAKKAPYLPLLRRSDTPRRAYYTLIKRAFSDCRPLIGRMAHVAAPSESGCRGSAPVRRADHIFVINTHAPRIASSTAGIQRRPEPPVNCAQQTTWPRRPPHHILGPWAQRVASSLNEARKVVDCESSGPWDDGETTWFRCLFATKTRARPQTVSATRLEE
jgi:hypothetical protein